MRAWECAVTLFGVKVKHQLSSVLHRKEVDIIHAYLNSSNMSSLK